MRRVVVAMSGGVDSSVAAALLAERGVDVTGVTLDLAREGAGCCGDRGARRAARAAAAIGIAHYVWDFRDVFDAQVVRPFVEAYRRGRTPNPCLDCNRAVKFDVMLDRVVQLGFDGLATGHYARIERDSAARPRLLAGLDPSKDQSYALYATPARALRRLLLPVGGLSKREVRAHAHRLGLPVADEPESQDICFVGGGDVADFVAREGGRGPAGPVLDLSGRAVGRHDGIHRYTIGQRRGLGVSAGERRYVIDIDARGAAIVVGPRESLLADGVRLEACDWHHGVPAGPVRAMVRYRGPLMPARVTEGRGETWVWFDSPVCRPAPGQAVVCYRGGEVLGGGVAAEAVVAQGVATAMPRRQAEATCR